MERDFEIRVRCDCGAVDLTDSRNVTTFDSAGVRAVIHRQLRCLPVQKGKR